MNCLIQITSPFYPTKCVSIKPENRKYILAPGINPPDDKEHLSLYNSSIEPFPMVDRHLQREILWQIPHMTDWGENTSVI